MQRYIYEATNDYRKERDAEKKDRTKADNITYVII